MSRCLALLAVLTLVACGGEETIAPVNQAPTIRLTFTKRAVPAGVPTELTVSISDPNENDNLTTSWSITSGSLSGSQRTSRTWTPPTTPGEVAELTVSVSDGDKTRSVSADITVGTLFQGPPGAPTNSLNAYFKSQSPYIVVAGDTPPRLVVPAGTDVVIEAGVQLLLDVPETVIDVSGTMTAMGTADDRVLIAPNVRRSATNADGINCSSDAGWWSGVEVSSDPVTKGEVRFNYTDVEFARDNIRLLQASTGRFNGCGFVCSSRSALQMDGSGTLTAENCEITNNRGDGINVSSLAFVPDSVIVTGCNISLNGSAGLFMDLQGPATQNLVAIIEFNRIDFNSLHGILLRHDAAPAIHNNFIAGNNFPLENVRLRDYKTGVGYFELDMTENFWGIAVSEGNEAAIKETIWDADHAGVSNVNAVVIVYPWLNTSPLP